MAEEKSQVIERVISRLSDMRMDLGPEERQVLDALIVGDLPEVTAHAFTVDFEGAVQLDEENNKYVVIH